MIWSLPARRWLVAVLLTVLPTAIYWETIFTRFGFRDDYSILRETREEPGKISQVIVAQARPLYAYLLEKSFARLDVIADLKWMRLLAALLLGAVSMTIYHTLRRLGWDKIVALAAAVLFVVLPSAQVLVSWAVSWPLGVGLLLAVGAFFAAEQAFGARRGTGRRVAGWCAAAVLAGLSALLYQSNALFYLSLVGAAFSRRRDASWRENLGWLTHHGAILALGVTAAFTLMMVAFAREWVHASQRVALEAQITAKLAWFFVEPLPHALALFIVNRTFNPPPAFALAATATVLLFAAGLVVEWRRRGFQRAMLWLGVLLTLLLGSYSVLLVVDEGSLAYRTLLPLTGVVLFWAVATLLDLVGRRATWVICGASMLVGSGLARWQAFEGFARTQMLELALIEEGVRDLRLEGHPRVFIRRPRLPDSPAPFVFSDEFGSLSTNSDWVPQELLKAVMREKFPGVPQIASRYDCEAGHVPAKTRRFDVFIDMRRLREFKRKKEAAP